MAPVMVLCAPFVRPAVQDLEEAGGASIGTAQMNAADLVAALCALADGQAASLRAQYLAIARSWIQQPPHGALREREREILQLVASGLTDKDIADRLNLAAPTVSGYLHQLYRQLGVHNRAGAVVTALARGLIDPLR